MNLEGFLGGINRKCANCGKLVADDPDQTITDDDGHREFCSDWCCEWYQENK